MYYKGTVKQLRSYKYESPDYKSKTRVISTNYRIIGARPEL